MAGAVIPLINLACSSSGSLARLRLGNLWCLLNGPGGICYFDYGYHGQLGVVEFPLLLGLLCVDIGSDNDFGSWNMIS